MLIYSHKCSRYFVQCNTCSILLLYFKAIEKYSLVPQDFLSDCPGVSVRWPSGHNSQVELFRAEHVKRRLQGLHLVLVLSSRAMNVSLTVPRGHTAKHGDIWALTHVYPTEMTIKMFSYWWVVQQCAENWFFIITVKEHPIIRIDLQIRTTFGFGWVGYFREARCLDLRWRKKYVHPGIVFLFIIL